MKLFELRRRAEAGSCASQAILGLRYLYGTDEVAVDYQQALRFLSAATEQGSSRAIANLAYMHELGLGTPRDLTKAIQLYERVGNVEFFAAIALGRIYSKELGLSMNPEEAFRWYSVAAAFEGRVTPCEELTEAKAYVAGRDTTSGTESHGTK
jgi:uncharacterized protein